MWKPCELRKFVMSGKIILKWELKVMFSLFFGKNNLWKEINFVSSLSLPPLFYKKGKGE